MFLTPEGKLDQIIDKDVGLPAGVANSLFLDFQKGLWVALDNGLARIELYAPLSFWGESQGVEGGVQEVLLANVLKVQVVTQSPIKWEPDV